MTDDKPVSQPEPKLRWYQYRLRTLLIFTFLVACACSLIKVRLGQAWLQRQAVKEILKSGGSVYYGRPGSYDPIDPSRDHTTSGIKKFFGYDYFYDVIGVTDFRADDNTIANLDVLSKLKQLNIYLINYSKEGLKHLEKLDRLESFRINANIDDASLKFLEKMPPLNRLEIRGRGTTDKCLVYIQSMTSLTDLTLWGGAWTSDGIKTLTHLTHLRSLTIYSINNIDDGLVILERMPLETLSLQFTPVTNAGLEHLKNQNALGNLALPQTKIDDAGLLYLKNMQSLNTLCLTDTNITGLGLKTFSDLDTLKSLSLDGTKITDDSLLYLSTLKQLEYLDISRTSITLNGLTEFLQRLERNEKVIPMRLLRLIIDQTPAAKSLQDNPELLKEFHSKHPDCNLVF
jgi:hypothetical protein